MWPWPKPVVKPAPPKVRSRVIYPDTCVVCAFSFEVPHSDDTVMFCRRNPPTVMSLGCNEVGPITNTAYPAVHDGMWCGEFKRRGA